jgi:FkbM family methyltransferase
MKVDIRKEQFANVASFITDPDLNFSYSQEGEDLLVEQFMMEKGVSAGFYVDVGAHHPRRFSNTRIFHMRGWRGVNIDAAPGSMEAFRRERPNDVNLEVAVDETPGTREFFIFNDPALNTCDPERVGFLTRNTSYRVSAVHKVEVQRLDDILSRHLPAGVRIDFLNIDVEGLDLAVARSNDWERFRPRVVLAEDAGVDPLTLSEAPLCRFMKSVGYRPSACLPRSTIYVETGAA